MSWQAMAWADGLPYDATTPIAYRVLLKLANVAADDGTRAWRSKKDMADELDVSERTIQRALKELRGSVLIQPGDQRHVTHIPANRRPTVFDLRMPRPAPRASLFDTPSGETARGDSQGRQPNFRGDVPGATGETTVVDKNDPRTKSKTKKESHVGERGRDESVPTFPSIGDFLPHGLAFTAPCLYETKHKRNRNVAPLGNCIVCEAFPVDLAALEAVDA